MDVTRDTSPQGSREVEIAHMVGGIFPLRVLSNFVFYDLSPSISLYHFILRTSVLLRCNKMEIIICLALDIQIV